MKCKFLYDCKDAEFSLREGGTCLYGYSISLVTLSRLQNAAQGWTMSRQSQAAGDEGLDWSSPNLKMKYSIQSRNFDAVKDKSNGQPQETKTTF